MSPSKQNVLLSVAVASCLVGAPALAETAGNADIAGLEVITVTAEKVTEDLQKTASAITAISGDIHVDAGVHDIRAAQNLVPSVRS